MSTGTHGSQLVRNVVSLVSGFMFVRVISFFSTLYITRALGPTEFGVFSFGLTLSFIFNVVTYLGLDDLLVREITRHPDRAPSLLGDAFLIRGATLLAGMLVVVLFALIEGQHVALYVLLGVYTVFYSCLHLLFSVFRGIERMEFQSLLLSGQTVLLAIGAAIGATVARSSTAVAVGYVVGTVPLVLVGLLLLRRQHVVPALRWAPDRWRSLLAVTISFAVCSIFLAIYERLPVVFISTLVGATEVGWFNAVHFMNMVLTNLIAVIVLALFPPLVRAASHSRAAALLLFSRLMRYTLAGCFALAIGLFALAPWIVALLFGPSYAPSSDILRLICFGVPFAALSLVSIGLLEATDHQKTAAIAVGAVLAVMLPVFAVATWRGGYLGSAATYTLAQVALTGALLVVVLRLFGRGELPRLLVKFAVALAGVGVVLALGRGWPPIALASVTIVVYAALVWLLRIIVPEDVTLLLGSFRRQAPAVALTTQADPQTLAHVAPDER